MTTINDPEVLDALRDKGCLLPGDLVNRDAVTKLLAAQLETNHIGADAAVAPGQLMADIFGVTSPELAKLGATLTSPAPNGSVQTELADGYMLCGARSKVEIEVMGITKSFSIATRFLSDDPDEIQQHQLDVRTKRAAAAAKADARLGDLVKSRRPEMGERVDAWQQQLTLTFRTALTAGSGE